MGIWLLRIPADPKNALFGGYSLQRLILVSGLFAITILALILAIYVWRGKIIGDLYLQFVGNSNFPVILFIIFVTLSLVTIIILIAPLHSILPRYSAIHTRLSPILFLIALMGAEGIILVTIFSPQRVNNFLINCYKLIRRWTNNPASGYMLLALSMLVSTTYLFYGYYHLVDEGDTITVGWLMSEGWVLYEDIFSHHFPLPYVWVNLVVNLFGSSILAIRLSLIFLRGIVFVFAMKVSRQYFPLGLAAFIWALWGYFYLGNILVYDSFSGFFILGVLAISLAILNREIEPRTMEFISIGILLGFAILTDPLMIFPTVFTIFFLFLSAIKRSNNRSSFKTGIVHVGTIAAGIVISIISFYILFGRLLSLPDFYNNGMIFNTDVYAKYYPQATIQNLIRPIMTVLGILNKEWFVRLDLFFPLHDFVSIDNSIFTGFFYRASILLACFIYLLKRRVLSGIYLFLFAASLLMRANRYFHISPFVLLSLFISSLLVFMILNGNRYFRMENIKVSPNFIRNAMKVLTNLTLLILLFVIALLSIRGGWYVIENRSRMSYEANFGLLIKRAEKFKRKTCDQANAKILDYPLNTFTNFLSQIPPASKYHFMTPWVAEIAQAQVISDLEGQPVLIHVPEDAYIWNYRLNDYIGELLNYLNNNFVQNDPNFYTSPQLIDLCLTMENDSNN